jgi:hypothetical protein
MEEDAFRDTYHQINTIRCPFEKALNARRCACTQAQRFLLAGRDGVGCQSPAHQEGCSELLALLREKARFALHLTKANEPLPHNKEMRVQMGSLLGLKRLLESSGKEGSEIADISHVVSEIHKQFCSFESLPFDEIIQSVLAFKGRKKR